MTLFWELKPEELTFFVTEILNGLFFCDIVLETAQEYKSV